MAKIQTLFHNCSRLVNQEKGSLFECREREGDLKDTHWNKQNAALNVDLS